MLAFVYFVGLLATITSIVTALPGKYRAARNHVDHVKKNDDDYSTPLRFILTETVLKQDTIKITVTSEVTVPCSTDSSMGPFLSKDPLMSAKAEETSSIDAWTTDDWTMTVTLPRAPWTTDLPTRGHGHPNHTVWHNVTSTTSTTSTPRPIHTITTTAWVDELIINGHNAHPVFVETTSTSEDDTWLATTFGDMQTTSYSGSQTIPTTFSTLAPVSNSSSQSPPSPTPGVWGSTSYSGSVWPTSTLEDPRLPNPSGDGDLYTSGANPTTPNVPVTSGYSFNTTSTSPEGLTSSSSWTLDISNLPTIFTTEPVTPTFTFPTELIGTDEPVITDKARHPKRDKSPLLPPVIGVPANFMPPANRSTSSSTSSFDAATATVPADLFSTYANWSTVTAGMWSKTHTEVDSAAATTPADIPSAYDSTTSTETTSIEPYPSSSDSWTILPTSTETTSSDVSTTCDTGTETTPSDVPTTYDAGTLPATNSETTPSDVPTDYDAGTGTTPAVLPSYTEVTSTMDSSYMTWPMPPSGYPTSDESPAATVPTDAPSGYGNWSTSTSTSETTSTWSASYDNSMFPTDTSVSIPVPESETPSAYPTDTPPAIIRLRDEPYPTKSSTSTTRSRPSDKPAVTSHTSEPAPTLTFFKDSTTTYTTAGNPLPATDTDSPVKPTETPPYYVDVAKDYPTTRLPYTNTSSALEPTKTYIPNTHSTYEPEEVVTVSGSHGDSYPTVTPSANTSSPIIPTTPPTSYQAETTPNIALEQPPTDTYPSNEPTLCGGTESSSAYPTEVTQPTIGTPTWTFPPIFGTDASAIWSTTTMTETAGLVTETAEPTTYTPPVF